MQHPETTPGQAAKALTDRLKAMDSEIQRTIRPTLAWHDAQDLNVPGLKLGTSRFLRYHFTIEVVNKHELVEVVMCLHETAAPAFGYTVREIKCDGRYNISESLAIQMLMRLAAQVGLPDGPQDVDRVKSECRSASLPVVEEL